MFPRYRVSDYRSYLNSLRQAKNISELKTIVTKEFNEVCSKAKRSINIYANKSRIKEIPILNDSVVSENSKILGSLQNFIEDKHAQLKKKYLKPKQIRKEAEQLCKRLAERHLYEKTAKWTIAGAVVTQSDSKDAVQAAGLKERSIDETSDSEAEGFSVLDSAVTESIPEPPPVPTDIPLEGVQETLNQLNALGEPTFASLGLGGWSPVGMVQNCMEYVHVTLGVEWWIAIVIGTLIIRLLMFPLVIMAQRNAAKMNNYMPQMQVLQMKMTEARQTGNVIEAARYSQEMMYFMKEKGLNPLKNMIVPLAQAPVFISFFMGLREMANVPVESMTHGGLFWFTDLTLPDQYVALPIITSLTLWATIEVGTDAAKLSAQNLQTVKYILRAMPVLIIPFTMNFPGAILCYWVSSNFISLGQVALLRIPTVRRYFNIEQMISHKPEDMPIPKKGFTEGIKESWTNMKITKELEERRQLDAIQFRRAGKGPIVKTYKYDPTKIKNASPNNAVSAKKRE